MKRLLDILRFAIISWETVVGLALASGYVWVPSLYVIAGRTLRASPDASKAVLAASLGLLGTSFGVMWKILFPNSSGNKTLLNWPGYQQLEDRAFGALVLCGVCSALALFAFGFMARFSDPVLGLTMLLAVSVPAVVTVSLVRAAITVRRLLEQYDDSR